MICYRKLKINIIVLYLICMGRRMKCGIIAMLLFSLKGRYERKILPNPKDPDVYFYNER